MAIVSPQAVLPEMAVWARLSHIAQLRFCLALMAAFGTGEDAIDMPPGREHEWAELRNAGFVAANPAHSLRLTATGRHVVMELVDHYLYEAPVMAVC